MNENIANARSKVDNKTIWPTPHMSPWPAWHGHETVPVTDFHGMSSPWNKPTSTVLAVGESKLYSIRFTMAEKGPRTRNNAMLLAGKSVLDGVPGYVLSPDMESVNLFVTMPKNIFLTDINISNPKIT